ncbi:molybdenum cofactor synthesis domain-containing protein [Saccharopolyspora erythraea NRRL 2338]|uniref:Bifunctional molybdopterim biosynthesis protein n=2 Tax=Saccharopolyspora erythraea TaxID=1836 RepID=A4F787_SACEN|nr:molybdenum cofactor biosynthesis protein MoaE [Saccharopolyspora erythraea]EQD86351.1 molybdenum cofactor biosynthesis protein MoaB [Saccharopolyspora erythraea D]PFG93714.1 molybdenum cofactor synthesis domain-containing protein [Saccharopolyspora erythraea NRRL 2338]QRK90556.1 molybdenum cofactor biosynthesis protein MoaE [Saccharopolyspora erythraea]CAL99911.1 putative bifunctional molybdopterim biosynthesis protein [Saccharopolyspora erythraea NRRL 2338]
MTRTARVVAASNRAAAGVYEDRTGPVIVEWLRARGYESPDPAVVPDGEPVGAELRRAVADGVDVVITTGGTGISPTDRTPEVTAEVLDYPIPGLAEALRSAGLPQVPTAVLSRGLAGVSGRTLIVNLPGSRGGVSDGLGVLEGVLDHAVDQIHGGDHKPHGGAAASHGAVTSHGAVASHGGVASHGVGEPHGGIGEPHVGSVAADGSSGGAVAAGQDLGRAAPARTQASVLRADVVDEAIDVDELSRLVEHRAAGAVVTFGGVVRDHDGGRGVRELEYTGHPSAGDVVAEVAREIAARFEGVRAIAVAHRIGLLAIGDVALGCAVAAEHRKQAFDACSELVDEVKRRLPIWKRQVFDDGSEEWVNCP